MEEPTGKLIPFPQESSRDILSQILYDGAREMLAQAITAEVQGYIGAREHVVDTEGHRLVVRNGYLPERTIQTPLGDVPIKQPRVRDGRPVNERETFQSSILPPYLRKTKSIEELLPWLYLKGISTGDFSEALAALLGPDAAGLSPSTITRMKAGWEADFKEWQGRSLAGKRYVYLWADGVYFNIRLEDPGNSRQCILVLMGATEEGKKELVAISDGYRESEQSWYELLVKVKSRGLTMDPKCATGDGALGFWTALAKVFSATRPQRCWVHKTANVLNKMPKSVQAKAKSMLHDIWMADKKVAAQRAFDLFGETFGAKYAGAVACLEKDREALLTFYDFPAEHWIHLRTTNPIESTFATVRLRTAKTKGCGSRIACLTMVFKLALSAEKRWRALNGAKLLAEVIEGVTFEDGVRKLAA
ncbi:MAG: IS256 family transposase [Chloroflexi bacterium]|nr:IS256 family transposase [Chloroflexota bacterium]MDA1094650.1 IS256 family transposase [Acidobacteriota bacterium]